VHKADLANADTLICTGDADLNIMDKVRIKLRLKAGSAC